jgi:hypothetical protein
VKIRPKIEAREPGIGRVGETRFSGLKKGKGKSSQHLRDSRCGQNQENTKRDHVNSMDNNPLVKIVKNEKPDDLRLPE